MSLTARELLEDAVYTREDVNRFLDLDESNWAKFDAELGYTLRDCIVRDGVDACYTISHYLPTGERKMINYAKRRCRINTYGDSFTQCHQVSDGETWQESLAAHLGEPIRNFGVGGYGVYQTYRRMLRQEATASSAPYLILNMYDDDHVRNLDIWRWLRIDWFRKHLDKGGVSMFHANPWAYVRVDPETGAVVEYDNPYPTPESLYKLCDKDHVYDTFKDDFVVQVMLAERKGRVEWLDLLKTLAATLNIRGDWRTPEACGQTANALHLACALRTSQYIVEKARAFAEQHGKRLMVLLSYSSGNVIKACKGEPRFDQPLVEFLSATRIPFVDTLQAHADDFRCFNLSPEDYVRRYYIGHYNPRGNHFFAFAVKDAIVEWLDPKPIVYREPGASLAALAADLA